MNLYSVTLTAPTPALPPYVQAHAVWIIGAPDDETAVELVRAKSWSGLDWDADVKLVSRGTTQEGITQGALPEALGGPLPGDPTSAGAVGPGDAPRPGDRPLELEPLEVRTGRVVRALAEILGGPEAVSIAGAAVDWAVREVRAEADAARSRDLAARGRYEASMRRA